MKREKNEKDNRGPFFSIIVPVYNVEKYLKKCVYSLMEQENMDKDFEILLIDDGSTDQSGLLCDEMSNRFPEVKTFHKENGGLLQPEIWESRMQQDSISCLWMQMII